MSRTATIEKPQKQSRRQPSRSAGNGAVGPAVELIDRELAGRKLSMIDIDLIDTSIQSRAVDEKRVSALAESISAQGLQSPIIVYEATPHADDYRGLPFHLGPGRHRVEAYRLLGLKSIPAFVRPPATAVEIHLAQMIENIQRKDLNPMEEAQACEVAMDSALGDVHVAAATLGVEVKWFECRRNLLRLSPRVQQMLLDRHINLNHAELLALLDNHEKQEEIAGKHKGGPCKWDKKRILAPDNVHKWKRSIEQELRSLAPGDVTWKLDVEFAGKVACSACPSNSANARGLFEGGDDRGAPKRALCLNAACYAEKSKAASSAVIRASNALAKPDPSQDGEHARGKPVITIKHAAEIAQTKDASFVTTHAIVERTKRLAAPPTKRTAAEKRGGLERRDDREIHRTWRKAHDEWRDVQVDAINAHLAPNDCLVGMALLMEHINCFALADPPNWKRVSKAVKEKAVKQCEELLALFARPGHVSLERFAAEVVGGDHDGVGQGWPLEPHNTPPMVRDGLCKVFKIAIPPEPKLENYKKAAKHEAKIEAAAEVKIPLRKKSKPPPLGEDIDELEDDDDLVPLTKAHVRPAEARARKNSKKKSKRKAKR